MRTARREAVSARVAATAIAGLPAAEAAAALRASPPARKPAKPRPKPAARPAPPAPAPVVKPPATITSGGVTYTLGPPLDSLPPGDYGPHGVAGDHTFVGDPVDVDRFGAITVTIVVQNGRIVDASAQMDTPAARSQYINMRVGPYLDRQVLQIQSAKVDLVAAATRTCQGYGQSLQSALDRAGIKAASG